MSHTVNETMRSIKLCDMGLVNETKLHRLLKGLTMGGKYSILDSNNSLESFVIDYEKGEYIKTRGVCIPDMIWKRIELCLNSDYGETQLIIGEYLKYKYGHDNIHVIRT